MGDDDTMPATDIVAESTIVGTVSPTTISPSLVCWLLLLLLALSSTVMAVCYDNAINSAQRHKGGCQ